MGPTDCEPLLLRVSQVAKLTGLTDRAIYRAAAEGRLPGARRIGRTLLFSRLELLRWLGAITERHGDGHAN
jgi:excisionase family DNA binding protein